MPENSPEKRGLSDILGEEGELDRAKDMYDDIRYMMIDLVNDGEKERIRGPRRVIEATKSDRKYEYTFVREQDLETGNETGKIEIKNKSGKGPKIRVWWSQHVDELQNVTKRVEAYVVGDKTERLGFFEFDEDEEAPSYDGENAEKVMDYLYWIGNSVFGLYGRDDKYQKYLDQ
jgi:hypothetical protein